MPNKKSYCFLNILVATLVLEKTDDVKKVMVVECALDYGELSSSLDSVY